MMLTLMKGKIHRATCTGADMDYNGSITIDPVLLEAAGIIEHEQVDVLNITNGERLTTYAIKSKKPRGSGEITINGAAAHRVKKGDLVIICSFARMKEKEAKKHKPKVVLVNARNQIATIENKSRPGKIRAPQVSAKKPVVKKPVAKKVVKK
ncbi:MAG: aspartate 1-decarboxylase [Rickettsiales bacterium]